MAFGLLSVGQPYIPYHIVWVLCVVHTICTCVRTNVMSKDLELIRIHYVSVINKIINRKSWLSDVMCKSQP